MHSSSTVIQPFFLIISAFLLLITNCGQNSKEHQVLSPGILISQNNSQQLYEKITKRINTTSQKIMTGPGIVAVTGGVHIKVLKNGDHEFIFPLPQVTDYQIPLNYAIKFNPAEDVKELRIRKRAHSNHVISVILNSEVGKEIFLNWASLVMINGETAGKDSSLPSLFLDSSPCVQSDDKQIVTLANDLWPDDNEVKSFTNRIQMFISSMKSKKEFKSLDARAILMSSINWICTGNANLATAFFRAKQIPARTVSVIPINSTRLEMHRIVQFYSKDNWHMFDPSSLFPDIPLNPWQYIIMAKTSMCDENVSMHKRWGTSMGCPYGQEIEFLDHGISLWGDDFFWTFAKPLDQFDPDEKLVSEIRGEWNNFLNTGIMSQAQLDFVLNLNKSE